MNAIDTNVFIYANDDTVPEKQALARGVITTIQGGVLLWQVACEFLSVSRKKLGRDADVSLVWSRLAQIEAAFPLVLPTEMTLGRARTLMTTHQLQLWDALIYAACLEAGIARLYSEDIPAQKIPGLEIVNPFARTIGVLGQLHNP